ncbi:chorismate-binding protein [Microbacterium sp. M3]|uniref:Chorismate-binding protein n=1 Tax=Microbacterium arthrosphaerae TaxID=792652 RepID=A0ABU4GXH9_9MICO|nr:MULTISPECIES: chorismate-binding protein [Microbacterium]MDW4571786.1 chorismate-binding protein [Microbacterium arthrosphaerae]MDW7605641.1 chorismate-binding protein [Microbacterium sp. M3]
MTSSHRPPRLVVETREIAHVDDLLAFASADAPLAWLRRGDGIVGIGTVGGYERGPHTDAGDSNDAVPADAWRAIAAAAVIDDPVGLPGSGLVAFGTLVFDERSDEASRLVVPQVVVGRHRGRSWVTRIHASGAAAPELPERSAYGPYWSATLGPGTLDPAGYQAAVRRAVDAIVAGDLEKVVLARDLVGTIPAGADLRRLVRALADDYPDTWTFAVDGLIGASPETLITASRGVVTARVLAGTIPRGTDAHDDAGASTSLAHSAKDLEEHRYAVQSVLDTLGPHVRHLRADPEPFTLKLPNLWHLATDVAGDLADHASSLDLVAALHPTAAVAGTPRDAALELIRRLEPFDRGRYAGPVGWVDGHGNGEWAIALRCAQIGGAGAHVHAGREEPADANEHRGAASATIPVVAHAGAGIVARSDPETELLETRVKFRPIVDALA